MNPFEKLKEMFREFPGIGPRQAERFVYFLLYKEKNFRGELVKEIASLSNEVYQCSLCFRFFQSKNKTSACSICADTHRDTSLLMVVPKDVDFESIEKSHAYKGLYFILGGTASFSTKKQVPLRMKSLQSRLEKGAKEGLKELIIATSINPEGEHTQATIEDAIKDIVKKHNITISTLGKGLSTGAEIEYVDRETLESALKGRKPEILA